MDPPASAEGDLTAADRPDRDRRARLAVDPDRRREAIRARLATGIEEVAAGRLALEVDEVDDALDRRSTAWGWMPPSGVSRIVTRSGPARYLVAGRCASEARNMRSSIQHAGTVGRIHRIAQPFVLISGIALAPLHRARWAVSGYGSPYDRRRSIMHARQPREEWSCAGARAPRHGPHKPRGRPAAAQDSARDTKVRNDRKAFEGSKDWIYNDLAEGIRVARETHKPLMVVFRCIPCEACQEFDDDVARRDPIIRDLLDEFVCVRIVQANAMDLAHFRFDFDLSFAVFFLDADLTIYGRFGTRSDRPEEEDISLPGPAQGDGRGAAAAPATPRS